MSNSNNISESDSRLDEARKYLVDILRAFGELNIRLGKDYGTKTGNIHSSVNSYVKQQMDQVRMPFPFDEAKKKNKWIINKSLGRDHLCVSIKQYLSWYRIWVRPIKQWVVRALEEQRYPEPGALDLFKQKVEEHNAIIEKISERITEEKIEGE